MGKLQTLGLAVLLSLFVAAPAGAQQSHVTDPATLDRLVAEQAQQDDAARAAIREALQRDDVREVARQAGLDLARAEAAVQTLSGAEVQEIAAHATQLNENLAGGQSAVVISTTTIIIIALVVLLIVAID